jgi:riboflavin transporter FmnP
MSEKDNHLIRLHHHDKLLEEKPPRRVALISVLSTLAYLQSLQVQLLPQLQFSQVQLELSHFCLSFRVVLLNLIADFINFVLLFLSDFDKTKIESVGPFVVTLSWGKVTEFWVISGQSTFVSLNQPS